MLVGIIVGFANERPPSDQDFHFVLVEARSEVEATLVATQMVGCHTVMPTSSEVVAIYEI